MGSPVAFLFRYAMLCSNYGNYRSGSFHKEIQMNAVRLLMTGFVMLACTFFGEAAEFVRIKKESGIPAALEIAITRFEKKDGKTRSYVDLVGVIHIADRGYYETLNGQFKLYDSVAFEGVGGSPARSDEERSANPLGLLYQAIARDLFLHPQADVIDYSRENFVHADVSAEEMGEIFRNAMKSRNESLVSVSLRIGAEITVLYNKTEKEWRQAMKKLPGGAGEALPFAQSNQFTAVLAKRIVASEITPYANDPRKAFSFLGAALGGIVEETLVTKRNERAMGIVDGELKSGKQRIGIFYGAAHMPDYAKLLEARGFKQLGQHWLEAWDMRLPGEKLQSTFSFPK